jgi:lysophospholipase L1-like esterase
MTRFAPRLLSLFCLTLFAAVASAADFPAPVKTMELNDGDTVVFLGDSITHQCLYTQYVEDFFYTRFPGRRINFHNAGIGGAKAWDALQRIDRDVLSYKPKYVTILLGMNDGAYQPFNQGIFDTYTKDMTEVVEKIKASGATPILMTPTMYDARAARIKGQNGATQEFYNSVLAYYGTWLRDVAERNGYGFVDMWSPLNDITLEQRKTEPQFTMIPDAVHPGPSGQLVMAFAILNDMDLLGPVSNIRIDASGDQPKGGGTKGGKLSDLAKTENGVTFTWTADALPWVVLEEARQGAKLLKLGHKGSREALVVLGLPAGQYELLIDGQSVGKYAAARFAAGVELQGNDKTPQYQQALKVAELNKQRTAKAVNPMRNDWFVFQAYAQVKRQAAEHPDDTKAAEKLKELEKGVAGLEEKIKQHEADAKAIEDEIFKANQPQPHKYEVRKAAK